MPELSIEVCSREEAGEILSSRKRRAGICFLVSIGEPHDRPPAGFASVKEKLRLLFADVNDASGPSERDVREIIAAAEALKERTGRVVVHCQAGISRSTAAAIIMYTVLLGVGSEREAVRRVFRQRPIACPNWRLIEIADRVLGCDGRLKAAVEGAGKL